MEEEKEKSKEELNIESEFKFQSEAFSHALMPTVVKKLAIFDIGEKNSRSLVFGAAGYGEGVVNVTVGGKSETRREQRTAALFAASFSVSAGSARDWVKLIIKNYGFDLKEIALEIEQESKETAGAPTDVGES